MRGRCTREVSEQRYVVNALGLSVTNRLFPISQGRRPDISVWVGLALCLGRSARAID